MNEIARIVYVKRRTLILKLISDKQYRQTFNNILLKLKVIDKRLTQADLFKVGLYDMTLFEFPLAKGCILGCSSRFANSEGKTNSFESINSRDYYKRSYLNVKYRKC